jgi:hypothetical protein
MWDFYKKLCYICMILDVHAADMNFLKLLYYSMYALSHVINVLLRFISCTCQLVILLLELTVLQNQFFCTKGIVGSGLIYWERPDIGIKKGK